MSAQTTAYQADNFVDSVGVNTHFAYPVYETEAARLEAALEQLGVRHVRDSLVTGNATYQAIHSALAAHGIKTLYIEPGQTMTPETGYSSYMEDVEAFEPPNEQNIVSSNPASPVASEAAAYASFLKTAKSMVSPGVPFLGPSFTTGGDTAALSDGGYHYSATPVITVTGGGGVGMSCTATMKESVLGGEAVAGCTCKGGIGYTAAPTLTVVPAFGDSFGEGASVLATVSKGTAEGCAVQQLALSSRAYAINNIHYYQAGFLPESGGWGGGDFLGNSYGSLSFVLDQFTATSKSLPTWATEAGYYTATPLMGALPEANLAAYMPRLLLNNFAHGIARTYLYELYDEGTATPAAIASNPGQAEQWSYGLVRNDGSFKPSFYALSNLIGLLADPGPSFTPGSLSYQLTGNTGNVHQVLFQKRDGSFWLALWIAASGYNLNSRAETPIPAQAISLKLSGAPTFRALYQMGNSGVFASSTESGQTLSFSVGDRISLVKIL